MIRSSVLKNHNLCTPQKLRNACIKRLSVISLRDLTHAPIVFLQYI